MKRGPTVRLLQPVRHRDTSSAEVAMNRSCTTESSRRSLLSARATAAALGICAERIMMVRDQRLHGVRAFLPRSHATDSVRGQSRASSTVWQWPYQACAIYHRPRHSSGTEIRVLFRAQGAPRADAERTSASTWPIRPQIARRPPIACPPTTPGPSQRNQARDGATDCTKRGAALAHHSSPSARSPSGTLCSICSTGTRARSRGQISQDVRVDRQSLACGRARSRGR